MEKGRREYWRTWWLGVAMKGRDSQNLDVPLGVGVILIRGVHYTQSLGLSDLNAEPFLALRKLVHVLSIICTLLKYICTILKCAYNTVQYCTDLFTIIQYGYCTPWYTMRKTEGYNI